MEKVEREGRLVFPFSAIVGLEDAKLALLCVAVNPLIGGVLLRGDKGTGKSTLVRALANVLPEIEVVADCPFNCNPRNPLEMCDSCYRRYLRGENLPVARRRMRVVDLPLSITVDRLVGTVDVERFMREGVKALQPGLLAEANRNILYIDEVNLLDDYVADSLLDAAAMGWNIIEREGVSFKHPARFILVGSMNPEEGELRPQILDRFGLCVNVEAPKDPEVRAEIVRRVEEFHRDPIGFYVRYEGREREVRERIIKARELLPKVTMGDDLLKLLARTVIELGIKTNRAEIVTVKTAKAIAALNGRTRVTLKDLEKAMELALPHRLRDKPFQKPPKVRPPKLGGSGGGEGGKDDSRGRSRGHEHGNPGAGGGEGSSQSGLGGGEVRFDPQPPGDHGPDVPKIPGLREVFGRGPSRDSYAVSVNVPRGYPIGYTVPRAGDDPLDIDLYNSVVSAILAGKKPPISVGKEDIRVRVRRVRPPMLWVIMLDSSGSMALQKRISVAKGLALKLVERSYVKKAKLSLMVVKGREARLAVPPTRNYVRVLDAIENVPTGGRTPLPSALHELILLVRRERMKEKSLKVRAFLITDGKANVPLRGGSVKEELLELGRTLRKLGVKVHIYSPSTKGMDPGLTYVPLLKEVLDAEVIRI